MVEQEILNFIELHQLESGDMPTQACFVALGRQDLHLAMSSKRFGRKATFMRRLNLRTSDSLRTSSLYPPCYNQYNNEKCYAMLCFAMLCYGVVLIC